MKTLSISNFGIIKSATNIQIEGLTVITGNNDTGKSTIGKLLFAIIKSIKRTERHDEKKMETLVRAEVTNLYLSIRDKPNISKIKFGIDYFTDKFIDELKPFMENRTLYEINQEDFNLIFSTREKILQDNHLLTKYPQDVLNIIKQLLKDDTYDTNDIVQQELYDYLASEFNQNITPSQTNLQTQFSYSEGDVNVLESIIENNKIINIESSGDSHFDDATFIESPLILQTSDFIYDKENSNDHSKDLLLKLQKKYAGNKPDIFNKLNTIIQGDFYYNDKEKRFYYSKENSGDFEALNSASGVKSFGLLQLLAKGNYINPKNLIIIDEPENHLHPEWQLKYAQVIIELIKNDISIIISTHSPYMMQALRHFGNKEKQESKIKYYLSEAIDNQNFAIINDVSENINKIFAKLAKPLTDLVWM